MDSVTADPSTLATALLRELGANNGHALTHRRRILNNLVSDLGSEPDPPRELDPDVNHPLPITPIVPDLPTNRPGPSIPTNIQPTSLPTNAPAAIPTTHQPIFVPPTTSSDTQVPPNKLTPSQIAFLQAYAGNSTTAKPGRSTKKSKRKKKSKKQVSSDSSSSSSTSTNSGSSSSSEKDESSNRSILCNMWPVEKRPLGLQNKASFNAISMDNLLCLAKFDKQNLKAIEGDLSSNFLPDRKPKSTSFKNAIDNGFKKLHPARFLRLPLSNIKILRSALTNIRTLT
ncbi:uncharacterized protein LOC111698033 [Eurytemora carolleeae]|uniref:uncharacterized protein LOC111698033 n=1 Tax=Eurytemora carolleeae TaxID=1294199 RepID=UPI000C758990|nr:uncharacterized protein LOC111698033 [Eurytemora carolleeae]|eukprot:XP_023324019.1 uncharacterized protein LOC111698033 [Eurytemora affinis]